MLLQVGGVLAVVVGNSAIALTEVSTMLQKAGPQDAEDGDTLVESGHAATVMAELLQTWGGRASLQALAAWKQSDLGLQALLPQVSSPSQERRICACSCRTKVQQMVRHPSRIVATVNILRAGSPPLCRSDCKEASSHPGMLSRHEASRH